MCVCHNLLLVQIKLKHCSENQHQKVVASVLHTRSVEVNAPCACKVQ
jgi:hypothetical protein